MLDGLLRILIGLDGSDRAGERDDPAFALAVLLIDAPSRSSEGRFVPAAVFGQVASPDASGTLPFATPRLTFRVDSKTDGISAACFTGCLDF